MEENLQTVREFGVKDHLKVLLSLTAIAVISFLALIGLLYVTGVIK